MFLVKTVVALPTVYCRFNFEMEKKKRKKKRSNIALRCMDFLERSAQI